MVKGFVAPGTQEIVLVDDAALNVGPWHTIGIRAAAGILALRLERCRVGKNTLNPVTTSSAPGAAIAGAADYSTWRAPATAAACRKGKCCGQD